MQKCFLNVDFILIIDKMPQNQVTLDIFLLLKHASVHYIFIVS